MEASSHDGLEEGVKEDRGSSEVMGIVCSGRSNVGERLTVSQG